MSASTARTDKMRLAEDALREGHDRKAVAAMVGTSLRNLERWLAAGLIDPSAEPEPLGDVALDMLKVVLVHPSTSNRDRISAANAIKQDEDRLRRQHILTEEMRPTEFINISYGACTTCGPSDEPPSPPPILDATTGDPLSLSTHACTHHNRAILRLDNDGETVRACGCDYDEA